MKQKQTRKSLKAEFGGRERTSCEQSEFYSRRCCCRHSDHRRHRDPRLLPVRGGREADLDEHEHVHNPHRGLLGDTQSLRRRQHHCRGGHSVLRVRGREYHPLRVFAGFLDDSDWDEQHCGLDQPGLGVPHRDFGERRTSEHSKRVPQRGGGVVHYPIYRHRLPVHVHRARDLPLPLRLPSMDARQNHCRCRHGDRLCVDIVHLIQHRVVHYDLLHHDNGNHLDLAQHQHTRSSSPPRYAEDLQRFGTAGTVA